jgi:protein SCO1
VSLRRRTAAVVGAVALLAGCSASPDDGAASVRTTSSALHGTAITKPYPLPDQTFTDPADKPYVPSRDATHPLTLVFFGYTHCPDLCNVVLANVAAALRRTDDAVRRRTQLLFVTTDPARDTTQVVHDYLARFDRGFVGLRADLPTMKAAAAALHITYDGTTKVPGGGYEVTHGTQVTAFRDGQAAAVWSADTPVADLRADLLALASD